MCGSETITANDLYIFYMPVIYVYGVSQEIIIACMVQNNQNKNIR